MKYNNAKKAILKDVAKVQPGYPFRGKIPEAEGTGVRVLQMKNIAVEQTMDWSRCGETELAGKREPYFLQTGDVVFGARGDRRYAMWIDDHCPERIVATPHFFVISARPSAVRSDYLAWWLNQTPAQHYFTENAEGSYIKSIRKVILETVPVVIPTQQEQQKIVQLQMLIRNQRDCLDQLIANAQKIESSIALQLHQTMSGKS